jgi:ribonuclease HII
MMVKDETYQIIAGVDEAGRGPLAGPVYAAAVILNPAKLIKGLTDSKLLSAKQREGLLVQIQENALAWAVGHADVEEIDQINILQATLLAMQRAVAALKITPQLALIDGNASPKLACQVKTLIGGDLIEPAISAASIIAKVTRDNVMKKLDEQFPQYGFAQHKGYGTAIHMAALKKHGPSPIHRRSFAPVAKFFVEA